jgi:hypothetical protein
MNLNKLSQAKACNYQVSAILSHQVSAILSHQVSAILNHQVAATFRLREKRNSYAIKVIIGLCLIPLVLSGCWPFDPIEREGLSASFDTTTKVVNQVDVSQNEVTVTVGNNSDSTSTIERYSFKYSYDGGPHIPDLDRTVTQTFDITSGSTKEVTVNIAPWEVITYAKAQPLREQEQKFMVILP